MKAARPMSSQRSTVHYPQSAPSTRIGGAAPTAASVLSAHQTTIRAPQQSRLGIADRGQALVGPDRLGPTRPHDGRRAPMGGQQDYKEAFKTTGSTDKDRKMAVVDFAHCKNMKGRFEQLSDPQGVPSDAGKCSYGAVKGTQMGSVRPQSARGMPSFSTVCNRPMATPPPSSRRIIDLGLQDREFQLENVLARAGI